MTGGEARHDPVASREATVIAVAELLLRADGETSAIARGGSMSPTIPSGATVRIRRVAAEDLGRGRVVAVRSLHGLYTHRIVARGAGRRSRDFILTRGDAATMCDTPVPVSAVVGEVTAWRTEDGWREVASAPRRPGWRGPVAVACDAAMRLLLEVNVALATKLALFGRKAGRLLAPRARGAEPLSLETTK